MTRDVDVNLHGPPERRVRGQPITLERCLAILLLLAIGALTFISVAEARHPGETVKKHRRRFLLPPQTQRWFRVSFPRLTENEKRHATLYRGHFTVRQPDTGAAQPPDVAKVRGCGEMGTSGPSIYRTCVANINARGTQPLVITLVAFVVLKE